MDFVTAVNLTPDLPQFIQEVERRQFNGIIGDIRNYERLDGPLIMQRLVDLASDDVDQLMRGETSEQGAGENLW